MSENERIGSDELVLSMVNQAAAAGHRRVGYIVSEADALRLLAYDREAAIAKKREEMMPWKDKVFRLLGAAGRAGVSVVFLAGAMEGLMDPAFAALVSTACVAWGGIWYRWGNGHG